VRASAALVSGVLSSVVMLTIPPYRRRCAA
jgi:hypothetical protein